jgi:hypothetical protein
MRGVWKSHLGLNGIDCMAVCRDLMMWYNEWMDEKYMALLK